MEKRIITISREFGSGGRFIGEQLAMQLGIPVYDKDIILTVAEESGLAEDFIKNRGEYAPKKNIFSYAFVGRDTKGTSMEDYIYSVQRKVILELAEKGSCVIVGRCADFILNDRTDCLNIFIHGNEKEKVKRIQELYHKTEAEAKAMSKEIDKKRSIHYAYYTEQKWGKAGNYAMCLNSSILCYDKCIQMIKEAVKD